MNRNNPFPGLRAFLRDENEIFFGRDKWISDLSKRLATNRFIAVIGESGSGKSSLVRAGLLPEIEAGFLAGDDNADWKIIEFRPRDNPLGQLANELSKSVLSDQKQRGWANPEDHFEKELRGRTRGLEKLLEEFDHPKETKILLVIDQFEEVFTHSNNSEKDLEEREIFVSRILHACSQSKFRVYVIITMRSDFLGDCAQFEGLPNAINESQFLVPRMNTEDRREAIVEPVELMGKTIDEEVVSTLLHEMNPLKDHLPLMQHVMMRMFDELSRRETKITMEHYVRVGRFDNALNKHIKEGIYDKQSRKSQKITRQVFTAISVRQSVGQYVRRPMVIKDLLQHLGIKKPELRKAILPYRREGNTFIYPHGEEVLTEDHQLDLTHEVIIRKWTDLESWVDEEADSADKFIRILESAESWASQPKEKQNAALLQGLDLDTAISWLNNREKSHDREAWCRRAIESVNREAKQPDLFKFVSTFITKSHETEHKKRKDREDAELEQRTAARRNRVRVFAGLAIMAIVIGAFWLFTLGVKAASERRFVYLVSADLYGMARVEFSQQDERRNLSGHLYFAESASFAARAMDRPISLWFAEPFSDQKLKLEKLRNQNKVICEQVLNDPDDSCLNEDNDIPGRICKLIKQKFKQKAENLTPQEWEAINSLKLYDSYNKTCNLLNVPENYYENALNMFINSQIDWDELKVYLSHAEGDKSPSWVASVDGDKEYAESIRENWSCLIESKPGPECGSIKFSQFLKDSSKFGAETTKMIEQHIKETLAKGLLRYDPPRISDPAKVIFSDTELFNNTEIEYSLGNIAYRMTCEARRDKNLSIVIYNELDSLIKAKAASNLDKGLYQSMAQTQLLFGSYDIAGEWYEKFAVEFNEESANRKYFQDISDSLKKPDSQKKTRTNIISEVKSKCLNERPMESTPNAI